MGFALVAGAAAIWAWRSMRAHDLADLHRFARAQGARARDEVGARLASHIHALERKARRWELEGGTPRPRWEDDARLNVEHFEGLASVEWVDAALRRRWTVVRDAAEDPPWERLDAAARGRLDRARRDRRPALFAPGPSARAGGTFGVAVPMSVATKPAGFMVGLVITASLLRPVVKSLLANGFRLALDGDPGVSLVPGGDLAAEAAELAAREQVDAFGARWVLSVLPTPDWVQLARSRIPDFALAFGLLLIALGSSTIHLLQRVGRHAADLEATEAALRAELHEELAEHQRLADRLRQGQRLEAIGKLAGGIAHDFNNLLTVIGGYAHLVRDRLGPDDPRAADVDEILHAADRAAVLTGQLLAFSRAQVLQPRVIDPNDLVRSVEPMLTRLIPEDIQVETTLATDAGRVRVDPAQLEQVLVNLAVNARDAMPDGGELRISTRNVEVSEAFARDHPGTQPGRHVCVAVADTGIGMDEATLARVFEPFFTTKARGQGTGLGLATAYGIVKQSAGAIHATSEPGGGTVMELYLPRVDGSPEPAAAGPPAATSACGSETVLVVEDAGDVRSLIVRALESFGYRVLAAGGVREAETVARDHRGPVDLLLADIVLPDGSAENLAARLAVGRPGLAVLYMSGYAADAARRARVVAEGGRLLRKPFRPADVAREVREVLDAGP